MQALLVCRNRQDFQIVAGRMLEAADKHPSIDPQLLQNQERLVEWLNEVGLAVVVQYEPTSILSLTICLDLFAKKRYHLNMCLIRELLPVPIPEPMADMIAEVFFGDKVKKVACNLPNALHYVNCLEEDVMKEFGSPIAKKKKRKAAKVK
jgi:hypothetical protein